MLYDGYTYAYIQVQSTYNRNRLSYMAKNSSAFENAMCVFCMYIDVTTVDPNLSLLYSCLIIIKRV